MIIRAGRREIFNAAHRLNNDALSKEENALLFGKCNYPNYHGHNYVLETWVEGEIDPISGYLIDLKVLRDIIIEEVSDAFDHKNLNLDCPDFKDLNPTAENIAYVIWHKLRKRLDVKYTLWIKLWETENNMIEYHGK
jgi:6-pyruvoyltetrahydropterin/6-carboxytetrahydropterin synthase